MEAQQLKIVTIFVLYPPTHPHTRKEALTIFAVLILGNIAWGLLPLTVVSCCFLGFLSELALGASLPRSLLSSAVGLCTPCTGSLH